MQIFVNAQAQALTDRGWWFQILFLVPAGFWFALCASTACFGAVDTVLDTMNKIATWVEVLSNRIDDANGKTEVAIPDADRPAIAVALAPNARAL